MLENTQRVEAGSQAIADHTTPLIYNAWYAAALSSEVTRTPLRRRILNQDILLYRTEAGLPCALQNRCAHRGFPLHSGWLKGDRIVCGYHGMEYGPDGVCAYAPTADRPAPALKLQRYPLIERGPFIWIWMSAAANADSSLLPDHDWLLNPEWDHLHGSLHARCSYVRMNENLFDVSHFPFLHKAHGVGTIAYARRHIDLEAHGDRLRMSWDIDVPKVTELRLRHLAIFGRHARRVEDAWLWAPGTITNNAEFIDLDAKDGERKSYRVKQWHMLTPESQTSCHYFWATGYDTPYLQEDKARAIELTPVVFGEDVAALEAVEEIASWETRDYKEASVPTDRSSLRMRRLLKELSLRDAGPG